MQPILACKLEKAYTCTALTPCHIVEDLAISVDNRQAMVTSVAFYLQGEKHADPVSSVSCHCRGLAVHEEFYYWSSVAGCKLAC